MPELPEVEAARSLLERRALGRAVTDVEDDDTYVCRPHAPGDLAAALRGRTFTRAGRIGKSMWLETDDDEGPRLGLHLGMAGRIVVERADAGLEAAGDPKLPGERADALDTAEAAALREAAGDGDGERGPTGDGDGDEGGDGDAPDAPARSAAFRAAREAAGRPNGGLSAIAAGQESGRADDPEGPTGRPTWERFAFTLEDGTRIVLFDKRRLGRAVLEPKLDALGPDAMRITRDAFRARVGKGDAPLKARIMDQSVLAGVGNLLADETLWQAHQPPLRPAGDLDDAELDALRVALRKATRRAIAGGGVHTGTVIASRRREAACPRCGAAMVRATVGGRTTWWCSAEQAWPR